MNESEKRKTRRKHCEVLTKLPGTNKKTGRRLLLQGGKEGGYRKTKADLGVFFLLLYKLFKETACGGGEDILPLVPVETEGSPSFRWKILRIPHLHIYKHPIQDFCQTIPFETQVHCI